VHYEQAITNAPDGRIDRYYDPSTDQFLSIDPDVAETGQPYAFTGDDPLNATDPLGLCWSPIGCGTLKRATHDVRKVAHKAVHVADDVRHGAAATGHWVKAHPQDIAFAASVLAIPATGGASLALGAVAVGASGYAAYQDASHGKWVSAGLDALGAVGGAASVFQGAAALSDAANASRAFDSPASSILSQASAANAASADVINRVGLYLGAGSLGVSALFGGSLPGDGG
jgi:RHS repeat-associated protein